MIPDKPQTDIVRQILYSDESVLAVDKPAGMLTVPGGYSPDTLDLRSQLEPETGPLWVVHRLDKDTSGVILFARNPDAHRILNMQFDQRVISKEYRAIIYKQPSWSEMDVDQPILVDGDRAHRSIISGKGKPASTSFKVLHRFPCFGYVAAFPHTGLTHQIRTHLASLGHPILMDAVYGKSEIIPGDETLIGRMALHAHQIQFTHPVTGEIRVVKSPIPADFRKALDAVQNLRQHDAADYNQIYNTVAFQVDQTRRRK
jgi:tRNA pseudouridine32 synthase / 23S rRNA pseudouridine746 synthase